MTVSTTDTGIRCRGINHSDQGIIATCDTCGEGVVKGHKGQISKLSINTGGYGHRFYCWTRHECSEARLALKPRIDDDNIAAGRLVKNYTAVVYKGRKVPKGTVGVVKWVGESEWGQRVGLAVEGQEKLVYTAADNVRHTEDVVEEATARSTAYNAGQKAKEDRLTALQAENKVIEDELDAALDGLAGEERRAWWHGEGRGKHERQTAIRAEIDALYEHFGITYGRRYI